MTFPLDEWLRVVAGTLIRLHNLTLVSTLTPPTPQMQLQCTIGTPQAHHTEIICRVHILAYLDFAKLT